MATSKKTIPAGAFKQGCLAILDEVDEKKVEVIVTKRGRPVAKVVPVEAPAEREAAILARLRGRAKAPIGRHEDLLAPSSTFTHWGAVPGVRRSK